jgi:hypothetical protein
MKVVYAIAFVCNATTATVRAQFAGIFRNRIVYTLSKWGLSRISTKLVKFRIKLNNISRVEAKQHPDHHVTKQRVHDSGELIVEDKYVGDSEYDATILYWIQAITMH